jgi:hypothetical protein
MKKLSPFILIGLIVFVVYYTLNSQNDYREIRNKGKYDTCLIRTHGEDIVCSFSIDGKDLTRTLSKPYATMNSGEQFRVYYYSEIPDKYYIAFEEPVINEADFDKTETIEINDNGSYLKFSYSVDGKKIIRFQEMKEGVEVDIGRAYTVKYRKSDINVGYIVF